MNPLKFKKSSQASLMKLLVFG